MGSVSARAPHHACTHAHEDGGGGRRRSAFTCGHRASTPRACEGSARRQRGPGLRGAMPRRGARGGDGRRSDLLGRDAVRDVGRRRAGVLMARISLGRRPKDLGGAGDGVLGVAGHRGLLSELGDGDVAPHLLVHGRGDDLGHQHGRGLRGSDTQKHKPTHIESEWRKSKRQRAADV